MLPSAATFAAHYVDHRSCSAAEAIGARIREGGLVTLDGLSSRESVLALARRLMTLVPHRDSDPDGLTTVRPRLHHAHRVGFAGLGNGELRAHTERSGVLRPPRLMLLVCQRPAASGGDTLLADGKAIHALLAWRWPKAAAELSRPNTAFFGGGAGVPTQVFTHQADGRVSIRLRQDSLAQFSPLIQRYLPRLVGAVETHQRLVRLEAGQGFLLDNERWLHARTAFTGDRLFLRALGDSPALFPAGFAPSKLPIRPSGRSSSR
ncbi:TauD/TfdA family dioxygenase [Streptomyces sp. NPDC048644]|uniref:TauD/TfdA family dioxygenase n=1 Tax=Streptomyces sp. NPDC048644 TaxID=3365582 RepID=UPI00371E9A58